MVRLIKSELIKNKIWQYSILACLLPVFTGVFIKTQIVNRTVNYIDVPVDTYTFALVCNTFLIFVLPIFVLLTSIVFAQNESNDNGWMLVLSTVKDGKKTIIAKCITQIIIIFISYISFTAVNGYLLQDWGMKIILEVVVIPLFYSFICFIPIMIVVQLLCIILPHVIEKVFLGMFLIIVNFLIAQTDYNTYFYPNFYYTIAQDSSNAVVQVSISILLVITLLYFGTKLTTKYIQNHYV
ncbi:hypothetical protein SAMN05421767_1102 [Granulicatella balaenopterae]|uniref:ABC-2 family transporter protein n=1 Tax=Granulicatella balaenopterae TaxID=137733 RepID=A0A1H9JQL7_9LACT|nr:hypothetical protein [Granulicatella balaenopterae]SEQ89120.1 hypothetical protein SAMN05421767_1102 [Granulicatella balaenopterae]